MKNIFSWGGASVIFIIIVYPLSFFGLPFLGFLRNILFSLGIWVYFVPFVLGIVSIIKESGVKRGLGIAGIIINILLAFFMLEGLAVLSVW